MILDLSQKLDALKLLKEEYEKKIQYYEATIKELTEKNAKLNVEVRDLRSKNEILTRRNEILEDEITA